MTTITIDSGLLEQALDALNCCYSEKYDGAKFHGAKAALRAALAAQPSNYSDWQQQRGVLADIVDEALASYEAWMAEDDYNATDALHKIMDHMRQRAASYAKPAQQPAPAWHDAPTTPGLWVDGINLRVLRFNDPDIGHIGKGRWLGPLPEDTK